VGEGTGDDISYLSSVAHPNKCATESTTSVAHRSTCATERVISVAQHAMCATEIPTVIIGGGRMWAPHSFCGAWFSSAPQN
jgi:hypothetical protein